MFPSHDQNPAGGGNSYQGRVDGNSLASSKAVGTTTQGRWPANLIHDGSDEVVREFPETKSGGPAKARTANGKEKRTVNNIQNEKTDKGWNYPITAPATPAAQTWDGYGTALKPAWEPIILAMKPLDGTFAENAQKWGVGGLWLLRMRAGLFGIV